MVAATLCQKSHPYVCNVSFVVQTSNLRQRAQITKKIKVQYGKKMLFVHKLWFKQAHALCLLHHIGIG